MVGEGGLWEESAAFFGGGFDCGVSGGGRREERDREG